MHNKGKIGHPRGFDVVERGHTPWRVEAVVIIAAEDSTVNSWRWELLLFAAFLHG